jgi:hypothetical protein
MSEARANYGWESDFPVFNKARPSEVREQLHAFVTDASAEQLRAWSDSIPPLQREVGEVLLRDVMAKQYSTVLEYELPLESRRTDAIFLVGGSVVVVELKGKAVPARADIDQAAAYGRDLRCYHRDCADRDVIPVLVPTMARGVLGIESGVHIVGPDAIDFLIRSVTKPGPALDRSRFLDDMAYRPLPTLIEAARELFRSGQLRRINRAHAATDPAVNTITEIIHEAARTRSRHLILLAGVPGAGKTLVGLRTVHAHFLDDLAVPRGGGKASSPAVFLSGNGPLVQVLQYELRGAGGGGKAFVRGVKDYVKAYSSRPGLVPPEHVLVFDEAQRAFDAAKVHDEHPNLANARSEPEHFVEFAERIPEWCVVVGLIGSGQEIHVGEEGGLVQWRWAIEGSAHPDAWTVHAPANVQTPFAGSDIAFDVRPQLSLDVELRFHLAQNLHEFVGGLLLAAPAGELAVAARQLDLRGFHLRITRSLEDGKEYLRSRYSEDPEARYGIVASSRDGSLAAWGIRNDWQSTRNMRLGPWYCDAEDSYSGRSCRRLETCVTEFGAQGLELDATLLAWGTDLALKGSRWSDAGAKKYRTSVPIRDPFQLRLNAYRVLLTRGRDACVVFVPPVGELDETYSYLKAAGFKPI